MFLYLTDPKSFTLDGVRALIASKDDERNRQLRVSIGGKAYLSDEIGSANLAGVKFRFETWCIGKGYCGAAASRDDAYVEEIYWDLRRAWELDLHGFIDAAPDELA